MPRIAPVEGLPHAWAVMGLGGNGRTYWVIAAQGGDPVRGDLAPDADLYWDWVAAPGPYNISQKAGPRRRPRHWLDDAAAARLARRPAMSDPAHDLITSDRVGDTPVFNRAGDRIGHIDNLSIDKVSGQVRHALMSFGGFLGLGERFHPLPWKVLQYDVGKGGYVVPLEKDALEAAPSYTKAELETFGAGDQGFRDRLYGYYAPWGAAPYW